MIETVQDKLVITIATQKDLPDIYHICDTFKDYPGIDSGVLKESIKSMVEIGGILLAEINGNIVGGVAGYVMPGLYNGDLIFSVMFLYMKKGYRQYTKKFIKELELVLLPTKVNKIVFGILHSKVSHGYERFYRMMGYKKLETHVYKNI